ncbi:hypothetical protein BC937DRAFT_91748 [Endogone sp. FLAS-F59071]|nr:hypothetical protein BC937DRAFT_91748 [Endogone sp. FLAS-F59071]|eukprot:RUS15967.1 hypothetical protein BC937DRAFT_91748 [Endogone sp. FLAS-F59071]
MPFSSISRVQGSKLMPNLVAKRPHFGESLGPWRGALRFHRTRPGYRRGIRMDIFQKRRHLQRCPRKYNYSGDWKLKRERIFGPFSLPKVDRSKAVMPRFDGIADFDTSTAEFTKWKRHNI